MNNMVFILLVGLSLSACVSNNSNTSDTTEYLDLTSPAKIKLIDDYWLIKRRVEPRFSLEAARKSLSGCVEFVVAINAQGKPDGYTVKKSYPQGMFDSYAAKSIGQWRWKSAESNKDSLPVLTTIQIDFMIDGARNSAESRDKCQRELISSTS